MALSLGRPLPFVAKEYRRESNRVSALFARNRCQLNAKEILPFLLHKDKEGWSRSRRTWRSVDTIIEINDHSWRWINFRIENFLDTRLINREWLTINPDWNEAEIWSSIDFRVRCIRWQEFDWIDGVTELRGLNCVFGGRSGEIIVVKSFIDNEIKGGWEKMNERNLLEFRWNVKCGTEFKR